MNSIAQLSQFLGENGCQLVLQSDVLGNVTVAIPVIDPAFGIRPGGGLKVLQNSELGLARDPDVLILSTAQEIWSDIEKDLRER